MYFIPKLHKIKTLCLCLVALVWVFPLCAQNSPGGVSAKVLPIDGEVFRINGHEAFVILPEENSGPVPWVWYAPTLPRLPGPEEAWMFRQFTQAGIAIAGIDAGESYGSPDGSEVFSSLYQELTQKRDFSSRPVMLGRSRGGLMALSWAAANPDKLSGFAGIYPVCDLTSYPGLDRACGAFHLTQEELRVALRQFNPVDRLEPLARNGVPLFSIHGDQDDLVPLDKNSGAIKERYEKLGGKMELIIPAGQGHNMWEGFFQCRELVDFVVKHANPLPKEMKKTIVSCYPDRDTTRIIIDAGAVRFKMAGGIGASWHAISEDSIDEDPEYKWALRYAHSRGSAWGGNPPVTKVEAWKQIEAHASWLGLSFLRVELSARMYEPERKRFDWDNEEMSALYRILDWAEANGADVFLQQMWSNVKWNAWPGVQPLLSAPRSVSDFAEGIATLLKHLTVTRKYTCIKWFCITNEPPGGGWGSWWSMGEADAQLTPALQAVREALDRKNIRIPLSGPDWTDLPPLDPAKIDFDPYIGAYDIHSYQGIDSEKQKIAEDWANWATRHGKPFFLSEIGDMRLGWKESHPGPKSFAASLSNAESILRGLAAGAGAFNRWSFTNRGDLDGQWQLIRTWNIEKKQYLNTIEIEPQAYYGFGILTRFCAKQSLVVQTSPIENPMVLSQSLVSPEGLLTVYFLNKSNFDQVVRVRISGVSDQPLSLYRTTEAEVSSPGYRMDPVATYLPSSGGEIVLHLPARSIQTLTGYKTAHDEPARK